MKTKIFLFILLGLCLLTGCKPKYEVDPEDPDAVYMAAVNSSVPYTIPSAPATPGIGNADREGFFDGLSRLYEGRIKAEEIVENLTTGVLEGNESEETIGKIKTSREVAAAKIKKHFMDLFDKEYEKNLRGKGAPFDFDEDFFMEPDSWVGPPCFITKFIEDSTIEIGMSLEIIGSSSDCANHGEKYPEIQLIDKEGNIFSSIRLPDKLKEGCQIFVVGRGPVRGIATPGSDWMKSFRLNFSELGKIHSLRLTLVD